MADDKPQSSFDEITSSIGDLSGFAVFGNQILVGIYRRPEVTRGGIILTDKTRDEDKWQGKTCFVLKKGPLAFVNDGKWDFAGLTVNVGDCVVMKTSDGFPLDINEVHCRLIEDSLVKMTVDNPQKIW